MKHILPVVLSLLTFNASAAGIYDLEFGIWNVDERLRNADWNGTQITLFEPGEDGKFRGLIDWTVDGLDFGRSSVKGRFNLDAQRYYWYADKHDWLFYGRLDDNPRVFEGKMKSFGGDMQGIFKATFVDLPSAGLLFFSGLGVILIGSVVRS